MSNVLKMVGSVIVIVLMIWLQGCMIKINCKEIENVNFGYEEETTEQAVDYRGA